MAKKGMNHHHSDANHNAEHDARDHYHKNDVPPVPEIQGKAKTGNKKAGPMY